MPTQKELDLLKEYEATLKRVAALEQQMNKNTSDAEENFTNLSQTLKNVVNDMSKTDTIAKDISKSFKGISSIADQLQKHTEDEVKLDSKHLGNLKNQLNSQVKALASLKDQLKIKNQLNSLEQKQLAELNSLLDENNNLRKDSGNYLAKSLGLLDQEIAKQKELEEIEKRRLEKVQRRGSLLEALLGKGIGGATSNLIDVINKQKEAKGKSIGGYISGVGNGTSDSIPAMLSNGESVINAKSTAMFGGLLSAINVAGGGKKFANGGIAGFAGGGVAAGSSVQEAIKIKLPEDLGSKIGAMFGPIGAAIGKVTDELIKELNKVVELAIKYDQATTDTARQLGVSKERVRDLRREYISLANETKLLTASELLETTEKTSKALGQSLMFTGQQANELGKLIKFTQLSEAEAGKLAGTFGKSVEESGQLQNSILRSAFNTGRLLGISTDQRKVMSEIAKISDGTIIKFRGQADALAAATVQAQKYGLTLEKVDKVGESLLNWESSIENELKAELITGRELNLERARAAALTGDQAVLTAELAQQVGTLEDFTNLNVLAQKDLAGAFGMTREEMSEMLMNQQRINLLGPIANKSALEQLEYAKANNIELGESLSQSLQQQSVNDRLVRVLERLNDALMGTAGLEAAGTAGATAAFNIQTARRAAAADAATVMFGKDVYSDYGKRTLITPNGAYQLYNGDTVVAGTKLFKGNDLYSGPKDSLTMGSNIDMSKTNQLLQQQINTLSNLKLTYYAGDAIKTNMQYSYNTFY
jgi:plasmid maintenance system antidote protein VapI